MWKDERGREGCYKEGMVVMKAGFEQHWIRKGGAGAGVWNERVRGERGKQVEAVITNRMTTDEDDEKKEIWKGCLVIESLMRR